MPYRTAKVLDGDKWVDRAFQDIKVGDKVQVFASDGTMVSELTAKSVPTACYPPGNFEFAAEKANDGSSGAGGDRGATPGVPPKART